VGNEKLKELNDAVLDKITVPSVFYFREQRVSIFVYVGHLETEIVAKVAKDIVIAGGVTPC
jgi:hypothetical protein